MLPARISVRVPGVFYLLTAVLSVVSYRIISPSLIVAGNAAVTASNILGSELLFRISIVSELASTIFFAFLAVSLYRLLIAVNRSYAMLMATLVLISVPISFLNALNELAALLLLHNASLLSVFSTPQLQAQALFFLVLHNQGVVLANIFWGLWLLPFGVLVYRSGFIPRILGVLLIPAGLAYLANSLILLLVPAYGSIAFPVSVVFGGLGEGSIIVWLLIKGAKTKPLSVASLPVGH